MMRKSLWILVVLALVAGGTSCDKIGQMASNVTGGIAGKVLNPDGSPHGLVMLVLLDAKTGVEVTRMSAEDTGTFFFQKIKPGKYKIQVQGMGRSGTVMPSEDKEINLTMGRTLEVDVHLLPAAAPTGDQGGQPSS